MQVGRVQELWRHPVKSMRGERIDRAEVGRVHGIPGDRGWAIRDEKVGEIRGAKKIGELMQFSARYLEEPRSASTPNVEIDLADGRVLRSDDPEVDEVLSKRLNRPVSLWSRQRADDLDHYRRVEQLDEAELRRQLALLPDEPIPDYSAHAPPELLAKLAEFVAPPGTYFDGFELHLLSSTSLETLSSRMPDSEIDVRRFRPNVVVDSIADEGYPEIDWCGRRLRIGSLVVEVVQPMSRCVMVTLPQPDLPKDPKIMRTLVREADMNLGVALSIVEPGQIAAGDPVELVD